MVAIMMSNVLALVYFEIWYTVIYHQHNIFHFQKLSKYFVNIFKMTLKQILIIAIKIL